MITTEPILQKRCLLSRLLNVCITCDQKQLYSTEQREMNGHTER